MPHHVLACLVISPSLLLVRWLGTRFPTISTIRHKAPSVLYFIQNSVIHGLMYTCVWGRLRDNVPYKLTLDIDICHWHGTQILSNTGLAVNSNLATLKTNKDDNNGTLYKFCVLYINNMLPPRSTSSSFSSSTTLQQDFGWHFCFLLYSSNFITIPG